MPDPAARRARRCPRRPAAHATPASLDLRSSFEVIGPDHTREIRRVELGQLLEQVQRIEEDADHVVERVEVVHADQTRGLVLRVVEMLVPRPVVHNDEVALFPRVAHAIDLAVSATRDDVEPGFAAVAMPRLIQAGRELVHDRGQAGGVIADRFVDEEQAARAALRYEPPHIVEARDEPRAVGASVLLREPLRAARVRVVAGERLGLTRPGRELLDRRVPAVLEERDTELLEHRLDAPGVEYRRRAGVVAVTVPGPAREMDRVPGFP